MDDDMRDSAPTGDIGAFEEWLQDVGESRGLEQDELINELMTSYWMMNELADVIDESGSIQSDKLPEITDQTPDSPEASKDHGENASGSVDRNLIDLIETLQQKPEQGHQESHQPQRPDNLKDTLELLNALREFQQPPAKQSNETIDLVRALKEFQQPTQDARGPDHQVEQLSERLESFEEEVSQLSTQVDQLDEAVDKTASVDQLAQSLSTRVDRLEDGMENAAATEQVSELAAEFSSFQDQLSSNLQSIEQQFSTLEQVLSRMLTRIERNEAAAETLFDTMAEIKPHLESVDAYERAETIKSAANREGAEEAKCEACGDPVQIGLLSRAECPHCGIDFDGLKSKSSWRGASYTLTEDQSEPQPAFEHLSTLEDAIDGEFGAESLDEIESTEFNWAN